MVRGFGRNQQYKTGKIQCRDFSDGSKVCLHEKAWSVFFATLNKRGWKEGSPMPKKTSETLDWYAEKLKKERQARELVQETEKLKARVKQEEFLKKWLEANKLGQE
jgi:hypothetical protein